MRTISASSSAAPAGAEGWGTLGMREHHLSHGRVGLGQGRLVGRLLLLELRLTRDLGRRVLAALLGLGDRLRGGVPLGARGLDAGQSSSRRASTSRNSSTSRTASSPRRASAAFVPSGSARICRASSIRDVSLLTRPGSPRPRRRPTLGTVQPAIGRRAGSASATATPRPAASRSSTSFAPSPNATTAAGSIAEPLAHELERRALAHAGQGELEEDRKRLGDEGAAVESRPQLDLEAVERLRLADHDDLRRRPVEPREEVADGVRLEPRVRRVGHRLVVQRLDVELVIDVDVHVEAGGVHRLDHLVRERARPSAGEAAIRPCGGRRRARPGSR